jgi:acetyl-CoA carboxylase biotin carboxyl carrier protein
MAKKKKDEDGKPPRLAKVVRSALFGRSASGEAEKTGTAGGIDLEIVRELARIAGEYDLAEVEVDTTGHVRVRRRGGEERMVSSPVSAAPPAIALAPPLEARAEPGTFISSPFVGTFYRSPSPDSSAFVEVGQAVRKGQVVCIVEAMKLMNEIESEADGKIAEVLVANGEHVEYGQHLFRLGK